MTEKLIRTVALIVFIATACTVSAQETATPAITDTATTTTAAAATTDTATEAIAVEGAAGDSRVVRDQLREVLHRLPPEVGRVLKLDPALWTNEAYVGRYPALKAFVAAHPEVAYNSRYYLEEIWIPTDRIPETAGSRMWNDMLAAVGVIFGVSVTIFVLTWIIRTLINQRRWNRLSRVQAEVHTKLLDRFSSNAEVMAYINTTAGRKFLEAAPIPLEDAAPVRAVSAPVNRVLWSVQGGLILFAAGIGLALISFSADKDAAPAFMGMGTLAIAVGGGFIVSAIASLLLSKRLGVWTPPPQPLDAADLKTE